MCKTTQSSLIGAVDSLARGMPADQGAAPTFKECQDSYPGRHTMDTNNHTSRSLKETTTHNRQLHVESRHSTSTPIELSHRDGA